MRQRHNKHRHFQKRSPAHPSPKQRESAAPSSSSGSTAEGRLQKKGRIGFILSEDPKISDVLIEGASLALAMDGDRVKARLRTTLDKGRRMGEIVEVLERARQSAIGSFRRMNGAAFLVPEDSDSPVRISDLNGLKPNEEDLVVVKLTEWPTLKKEAAGILMDVLGPRSKPGVDLLALVRKYELPDTFAPDVLSEAKTFGDEVPESAYANRETFFNKNVVTIDGADAKDFDDAVSIEPLPGGGWRLGVHIADVAQYVRPNSPLDREAFKRGTSVYLTGNVIPMLPFPLSDNLCSLRPHRVRLTLTCLMEINAQGQVTTHRIFESAIRSDRRFTYEEVQKIIDGQPVPEVTETILRDVKEMEKLARLLRRLRFGRGSLDFDFPEPYVTTDPHGRPVDIQRRERLEAHRLIEDFMLLANETVATHMSKGPFLYRIHEKPDPDRLEKLRKTLEAVGIPIPPNFSSGKPAALQKVIASVQGKPVQAMAQMMVLRSLKQAVYSDRNAGHFGLASPCYTHFTSPIRRYPDLIVHRALKNPTGFSAALSEIALHCSRRERLAVDAEREYFDLQKVRLMEKRVGETFTGVISGVAAFGFFVQLNEFFVEGLVRIANLDDYYFFDEVRMVLRGKRAGRIFQMGQAVKIKLAAANALKRQLDFELIEAPKPRQPHSSQFTRRRRS